MRGSAMVVSFARSAAGIALVVLAGAAQATETITYTYDALGRLVKVSSSGTVNNNVETIYTNDAADNRAQVVVTGSANPPPS